MYDIILQIQIVCSDFVSDFTLFAVIHAAGAVRKTCILIAYWGAKVLIHEGLFVALGL